MHQKIRSFFKQPHATQVKPVAMMLLILLCLISSCTVRKGIQSFLSDRAIEQNHLDKPGKNTFNKHVVAMGCNIKDQILVDLPSLSKQGTTSFVLLFSLLPAFMLSSDQTIKQQSELPVPYSKLQWSCLPLFIQNRLLLI
jgi:hypothetical protein